MADLLLVDNDARITELLAWFLERAGHAVRVAESYAVARERIGERAPELLLADLELGAERGEEELARLAAEGALPPTLVVSGYLDPALEARLGAIPGVLGTLAKPFDVGALEARIGAALAQAAAAGAPAPAGEALGADAAYDDDDDGWIEIVPAGGGAA